MVDSRSLATQLTQKRPEHFGFVVLSEDSRGFSTSLAVPGEDAAGIFGPAAEWQCLVGHQSGAGLFLR